MSDQPTPPGASRTRSGRRPFAAGVHVTRHPDDAALRLRIDAPAPFPDWRARVSGDPIRPLSPGSAVRFEGEYYEVVAIDLSGGRTAYRLSPWEDRFPLRVVFDCTPEYCADVMATATFAERPEHRNAVARSALQAGIGLLPAATQAALAAPHGWPARACTVRSAVALLALSLGLVGPALRWAQDGIGGGAVTLLACFYFVLESVGRLLHGKAMGSLPLVLPYETVRHVRAAVGPRVPVAASGVPLTRVLLAAMDEVRATPDGEHHLEVVSLLPKPHWTLRTGIRHDGVLYRLTRREALERDGHLVHRFLLARPREHEFVDATIEYHPEEVRDQYRALKRRRYGARVHAGYAVWGLLPADLQAALADLYDFQPLPATRLSAVGSGLLAVVAFASAAYHLSRDPMRLDLWILGVSGIVAVEAVLRLLRARRGVVSGSLLGLALQPIARRMCA